jgi:hypothetical protein
MITIGRLGRRDRAALRQAAPMRPVVAASATVAVALALLLTGCQGPPPRELPAAGQNVKSSTVLEYGAAYRGPVWKSGVVRAYAVDIPADTKVEVVYRGPQNASWTWADRVDGHGGGRQSGGPSSRQTTFREPLPAGKARRVYFFIQPFGVGDGTVSVTARDYSGELWEWLPGWARP